MTNSQLERRVRMLSAYSAGSSLLFAVLFLTAFGGSRRERFEVIDVERINIVEPGGRHAVVISNAPRMPGNIMNGRERRDGVRGSGLLFYNADGNEAGGLLFSSARQDTAVRAFGQLTLDRFESDQVAALRYVESRSGWEAGLQVSHYPRHNVAEWHAALDTIDRLPTSAGRDSALRALRRRFFQQGKWEIPRLFAGERGKTAVVELRDMQARERLRLVVDSSGAARLEFLDEKGKVVTRIPDR